MVFLSVYGYKKKIIRKLPYLWSIFSCLHLFHSEYYCDYNNNADYNYAEYNLNIIMQIQQIEHLRKKQWNL